MVRIQTHPYKLPLILEYFVLTPGYKGLGLSPQYFCFQDPWEIKDRAALQILKISLLETVTHELL